MNTPQSFSPNTSSPKTILLSQMKIHQRGQIVKVLEGEELSQRLLEMGLTVGTDIEVIRFAPLGDPIDVKVRGYHLSLRRQEAEVIHVSLQQNP